jgi:hypothetical protein
VGDPSPRRIVGKLENYQIIVVKEPITTPTVGKLVLNLFMEIFGGDFEGLFQEEKEAKIGA